MNCLNRLGVAVKSFEISLKKSLHGEFASIGIQDFVGNNNFLSTSPEVLMTPCVSPFHEVEHRKHRKCKASCKGLSSNDWKEQVS